jgi:cobalt-zinc-cadmium resistance protein CzcA
MMSIKTEAADDSKEGIINRVIRFSVDHRGVVLILTVLAGGVGWWGFQSLPIDAVPDITNVQVQVNSSVAGLAPEEIERYVTAPIEAVMSGAAGVTAVRSSSRFGLSQVTIVFDDDVDIYRARQLVAERLQTVAGQLPAGVEPRLGPVSTGLGEIFHYTIEAEKPAEGEERVRQLMELRALQDWFIRPRLLTVKGVAEVNAIGGYEKQFHVQPRPRDMARYGIHFEDIAAAVRKTNLNVGGGYVQQTAEQYLVQAAGLFKSVDDVKRVPVKSLENLRTVTVGDIAEVGLATELRTGAALVRGREAVVGSALMLIGENSRAVSLRVAERLVEIGRSLPPGYKIEPLYDRSDLVGATLRTVEHNLVFGAALVVVVLLLLIGNVRAALIAAVTIPLSLLMTFYAMGRFGVSGNLMSLGALDFGIIIDGAVIVLDNCVRVIEARAKAAGRSLTREELRRAVYEAAVEIRTAAGFGEIIIVMVFLPVFGLLGVEGKMFHPMAAAFCIAVLSALVLSFTAVPALASLLLTGATRDEEPWLMRKARTAYAPVLSAALSHRRWTVGIGVGAVVLGGLLFARLGGEFLPRLDEGSITFRFIRPASIAVDQSAALEAKSDQLIAEFPEVSHVFARLGTAEVANDPMGINETDTFTMLKPRGLWPRIDGRRRTKAELTAAILEKLEAEIPGQRTLISQPIEDRFNELLEGTKSDLAIKVFGDDIKTLDRLTKEIAAVVRKTRGAGDVEEELRGTVPLLQVLPKEGILARLGVSDREVLDTVATALGGEEVGFLYEGSRRFPIVLRLNAQERSDLEAIKRLPVGVGANANIPLAEAATLRFKDAYGIFYREQTRRRSAVLVNIRGRDTEGFVGEAQQAVAAAVKLPAGYYVEWGGNFQNLRAARSRLLLLTPIALALVLMMIYAAFKSVGQTLLVFTCVPLALVGGVVGLIANGLPFSISAGVGFIALSGIAVMNGIVLVQYYNDLRAQGLRGEELIRSGALIRLRPVLMTALVDIFGFLPMMLSSGVGAEVQKPLASVVIGGIFSSTLLTLLVLPTLYAMFERELKD